MQSKDIKTKDINLEETIYDVDPPPPDMNCNFKTLYDWLINICDSEKPNRPITIYSLGLFESPDDRVIFLVGLNKYGTETHIDFRPTNMYFKLPETEYRNVNRDQFMNNLTIQLQDFTSTKKFKSSFLANADSIIIDGNRKIWSK